jgi:cysteine-rich repeat protein
MATKTVQALGILSARGLVAGCLAAGCFSPGGNAGTAASTTTGTTGTTGTTTATGLTTSSGTTATPTTSSGTTAEVTPTTSTSVGTLTGLLTDTLTTTELTEGTLTEGTVTDTTLTSLSTTTTGAIPVCGDDIVDPNEECDDGNTNDNDGCSAICKFDLEVRYVFVTSAAYLGQEVGGLVGGDAKCNELASFSDIVAGRHFVAWLSTELKEAKARLSAGSVPYARTDNVMVAPDNDGLLDGTLDAPIDHDEHGLPAVGSQQVWTGTMPDGTAVGEDCNGWGFSGIGGWTGLWTATDATWSSNVSVSCLQLRHLYCIEAP